MKIISFFFFVCIFSFSVHAQSERDTIVLPQMIIDGDTLEEIILEPILVTASKLEKVDLQEWQMRYLRKVYPYALRTARLTKKIDEDLQNCKTKKERKRYLNECEKVLRAEFETTLRNMSRTQGKYLIKLINRETGQTVFELLKEYRSNWKAFWWNFAGKFFDLDLKAEYDPSGEDKQIENYIQRLQYIYHTDGTNYLIQHEQFHTPIPGEKRSK
ncbi:MAG: DUF4294 domain-containing protein [Chitinophagales bacterium]|nr:DUF4294 domain-containing protein [Chitinophagales bacterium]HMV15325.1 DUF4294 domain-containing protein [Chitinophagales bacterium]HMW12863.1 DUF4294 domain-containing protein [Chitinophagales bacterium]HMX60452.1 DUF4294 domain-containing protein [Chitinophagales bacterium]HMY24048.1 DUF4294 domain-containing protein [Chitinophagales bacterium]